MEIFIEIGIYILMACWVVVSIYKRIVQPSVFTTLGVLGTFGGIYLGLQEFDVNNINDSIPDLLEGLKTAFRTSIVGIFLSLFFGKISQGFLRKAEEKLPPKPTGELETLKEISKRLGILIKRNDKHFEKVQRALVGDSDTSLPKQILGAMEKNKAIISQKFDEFSEILAKNNTEALVEVMKTATEQFNEQMSALIEKLVQENFQELNDSVNRMNQWQQENKEMIGELTDQFTQVSKDFQISSDSIKEIADNTNKLTNENSHLTKLIEELQKVMIEDTKYQEIVNKLISTIDTLKENTETFDQTTEKLNKWVRNQMDFSDSVAKLLTRLEEIDRIKDINDVFWNNTKKQLDQGVSVIQKASGQLSKDVEGINQEFYDRLNDTLQNLDTLIQRIIDKYR